jgi:acetyl-CoA acetyltransferase
VYDAFSINIPIVLEAVGFCKHGEGLDFVQGGRIEVGGELPCNTSGGMLSESYMHGWNHAVEAVRQLRGQAGARQVAGAEVSLYTIFTSEMSKSLLYRRMP